MCADASEEAPLAQPHPEDPRPPYPLTGLEALPDHTSLPHWGPQRAPPPAQIHAAAHALWSHHMGWGSEVALKVPGPILCTILCKSAFFFIRTKVICSCGCLVTSHPPHVHSSLCCLVFSSLVTLWDSKQEILFCFFTYLKWIKNCLKVSRGVHNDIAD